MSDIVKYEDQNMFVIRLLAEVGHTDEFICKLLGVPKVTWTKWQKDNPDFKRALMNWKKIACGQVEKKVFERAVGYDYEAEKIFCNREGVVTRVSVNEHVPPDINSAKFFLVNQSGGEWKEKTEVDHGLSDTLADAINRARGRSVDEEEFLK
jgi:hypothetical protein